MGSWVGLKWKRKHTQLLLLALLYAFSFTIHWKHNYLASKHPNPFVKDEFAFARSEEQFSDFLVRSAEKTFAVLSYIIPSYHI